jgi:hypothetical protein
MAPSPRPSPASGRGGKSKPPAITKEAIFHYVYAALPTIRAKFNTYRFADFKDKVIDLIARVTRVSVQTQAIVEAMKGELR